jgi:hypothetical protein
MLTVSKLSEQGGFLILHSNLFTPRPNPFTCVEAELAFIIVPEPETNDHVPVPNAGRLPFNTIEFPQITLSFPAKALLGGFTISILTSDVLGAHVPLEIVHLKIDVPGIRPFTIVVGSNESTIVPDPEISFQ